MQDQIAYKKIRAERPFELFLDEFNRLLAFTMDEMSQSAWLH